MRYRVIALFYAKQAMMSNQRTVLRSTIVFIVWMALPAVLSAVDSSSAVDFRSAKYCVDSSDSSVCSKLGLPNGDYAGCNPLCEKGYYITCSDGTLYQRDCSLSKIAMSETATDTQKLLFEPDTKSCGEAADLQCDKLIALGGPGKK